MASRAWWLVIALALGFALACERAEGPSPADAAAKKKKLFKPALPEPPDYQKLVTQALKASNGAWTVYGISMNKQALLEQQVEITGRVKERVTCTDAKECPARPYAMLEDPGATRFQVMVVRENDKGFGDLEPGATVTLVGRLVEATSDGKLFRTEGILIIPGGVDPEPEPEVAEPPKK